MGTSRALISGELQGRLVRRKKRADGSIYGIATVRDRDRLEVRRWKVFFNDLDLIERVEKLRPGEPIALVGPYYAVAAGEAVQYVATAFEVIDLHWKRKTKKQIRIEEKTASDEHEEAPREDGGPNDEIGF